MYIPTAAKPYTVRLYIAGRRPGPRAIRSFAWLKRRVIRWDILKCAIASTSVSRPMGSGCATPGGGFTSGSLLSDGADAAAKAM